MRTRDIIVGLVIIAVVAAAIVWFRRSRTSEPTPTPSVEDRLEETFRFEIPEDMERAELRDVSGGMGSGLATRKYEAGKFSHAVLADLPDPETGTFYEGWLVRGKEGDSNFAFISTGAMRIVKGGFLLEFESSKDYSDYKGVVITLEKVNDKKPETHILQGSF